MRLLALAATVLGLNSLALTQPWPWPTADEDTVHQINNNYGAYQEFERAPYPNRVVVELKTSGRGEITVSEGEWKSDDFKIATRVDAKANHRIAQEWASLPMSIPLLSLAMESFLVLVCLTREGTSRMMPLDNLSCSPILVNSAYVGSIFIRGGHDS